MHAGNFARVKPHSLIISLTCDPSDQSSISVKNETYQHPNHSIIHSKKRYKSSYFIIKQIMIQWKFCSIQILFVYHVDAWRSFIFFQIYSFIQKHIQNSIHTMIWICLFYEKHAFNFWIKIYFDISEGIEPCQGDTTVLISYWKKPVVKRMKYPWKKQKQKTLMK